METIHPKIIQHIVTSTQQRLNRTHQIVASTTRTAKLCTRE